MNLIDRLLAGRFKSTLGGQWSYFPYGRLGRGYVVSAEQYQKIRGRLRNHLIVGVVLGVALMPLTLLVPYWLVIVSLLILAIPGSLYESWWNHRFTRQLTPTEERLTAADQYLNWIFSLHTSFCVGTREVHRIAFSHGWSLFSWYERYRIDDRQELQFQDRCTPAVRRFTVGASEVHEVEIRRKDMPWSMQVFVDGELLIKELFPTIRKLSLAAIAFLAVGTLLLWLLLIYGILIVGLP